MVSAPDLMFHKIYRDYETLIRHHARRMKALSVTLTGWRFIGWLGVASLCAVSLLPPSSLMNTSLENSDKLYHLAAYTSLTWWFALGYARRHWRRLVMGFALLGILLEVLQGLTPERVSSAWDEIANLTGILLGLWLAAVTTAGFPAMHQAK